MPVWVGKVYLRAADTSYQMLFSQGSTLDLNDLRSSGSDWADRVDGAERVEGVSLILTSASPCCALTKRSSMSVDPDLGLQCSEAMQRLPKAATLGAASLTGVSTVGGLSFSGVLAEFDG